MSISGLLGELRDYLSLRDEAKIGEWFDDFDWRLNERNVAPTTVPVVRHLPSVLKHVGKAEARLVRRFVDLAPHLQWLRSYTADDFGQYFYDNYAHVEIIGTRGHFASDVIAAGLVLYGPHIDYPNHWHVAEEIYIPFSGGGLWNSDNAGYVERAAGEYVFHESNMPHAIKTNDVPMLALWIWRGGDLAQKGRY